MKKLTSLLLTFVLATCLMISTAFAATDYNQGSYIEVTGFGTAPAVSANASQARMMARRAAVVDAYRNAAEEIQGVQVDAETTVEMMATTNDTIKTKVSGLVRNATIVSEKVVEGNGYEVTMRIPMFGVSSVASAVIPQETVKEAFPEPSVATSSPSAINGNSESSAAEPRGAASFNIQKEGNYTGLIIDCHGLGLKPAMSPVIKNANLESIYGYKNLDYNKVVSNGMAGYANSYQEASRAGNHPLIVKAIQLLGRGVNPVVSMEDADKILLENQVTHFLDNTNVVFMY